MWLTLGYTWLTGHTQEIQKYHKDDLVLVTIIGKTSQDLKEMNEGSFVVTSISFHIVNK